MSIKSKTLDFVYNRLIDLNAQNMVATPAFALLEVTLNHMTVRQSIDARISGYLTGIAGTYVYSIGNTLERRATNAMGFTSKAAERVGDTIYCGVFHTDTVSEFTL